MPEALLFEFSGVSAADYRVVNHKLGLDPNTGDGAWPVGLLSHTEASTDGGFLVFEVWESQEAQIDWMTTRLGSVLVQIGIPEPTRVLWSSVVGHYTA